MRNSLKTMIGGAILAGSLNVASAGDMALKGALPPLSAYDWSGWYLGVGVGGLWSDTPWTFPSGATINPAFEHVMLSFHGGSQFQWKGTGLVIGSDYSVSMPLDYYNAGNTGVDCPAAGFTCQARLQSLFTNGGKIGWAWDRTMIYASGGWAMGTVKTRSLTSAGVLTDNTERWHTGYYVGGGIDYMVYKTAGTSALLGLEYQHIDLGEKVHTTLPANTIFGVTRNVDFTADYIKAKLTIKLDGPPFSLF